MYSLKPKLASVKKNSHEAQTMSTDINKRLETLRRLLDEKAKAEPEVEEIVEAIYDQPSREPKDPDKRPASLEGLSWHEIELLEIDGLLTQAEKDWKSYRSGPDIFGTPRIILNRRSRL
jgi:hypothetical protein